MGFKTATKKISKVVTLSFQKIIEIPANWTGEQIDKYIEEIDLDELYESTPDEVDTYWRLLK